jgi:hypothetical protein
VVPATAVDAATPVMPTTAKMQAATVTTAKAGSPIYVKCQNKCQQQKKTINSKEKTTAGLHAHQQQHKPCNSNVDCRNKNNIKIREI